MAETVRVTPDAHAALVDIAKTLRIPLSEALSHAIRRYQRDLFFERLETSFAGLTAREREEDQAELTAWDPTLSDGPESV
jgi:hypothetical protein